MTSIAKKLFKKTTYYAELNQKNGAKDST